MTNPSPQHSEQEQVEPSEQEIQKGAKYYAGLVMFWLSWLVWGLVFIIPLLDLSAGLMATLITVCLVSAEVLFFLSLFCLGKAFWLMFKQKAKALFSFGSD